MLENAAELWAWFQEGAHFYVCGDASRMAKDVDMALHTIAETAGGLGKDAAAEFVSKLKSDKRYQRDVY
jgi:sulfite reductase (NADPH) flavoprotein alpha-component